MARNPRVIVPGYAYHLTQRGTNRQDVFHSAGDRRVYLTLMRENLNEAGIRLLAFCLMTNHVHFVVVPEGMDSMSVWMRRVNGRYAQYYNARMNRTGHLWQARFFSCAMSWRHRAIGLRYVEMNPVRAHLVARPEEYAWSSAAEHLSKALPAGSMLDRTEWEERGGSEGWADMLGLTIE
jgi:putative transposase